MKRNRFFLIHYLIFVLLIQSYAGDTLYFPYDISWKTDIPVASVAALTGILGSVFKNIQPKPDSSDIISLKSIDINQLDRTAVDNYSETANLWSSITLWSVRYSHFLFYIPLLCKKQWYPIVAYTVMYYEAMAINGSLTSITKSISNRARPYIYGSHLSVEKKLKKGRGGFRSFYSGHTSGAFCSAVFISKIFSDVYPSSRLKGLVWGLCLSTATTTGILRYTAGKHYPTDVIAGACMGSFIGYFIPALHKKKTDIPVSVYPIMGEKSGIKITFRF